MRTASRPRRTKSASICPTASEYVVDTSEFEDVKQRLASLENSRHLGGGKRDPSRPVLLQAL